MKTKTIYELMNKTQETSKGLNKAKELLNGLRSESGWERLQTAAKIALMAMGGGA